jgi:hypothetical protein
MLNMFQQVDHPIWPKPHHDERARQKSAKSLKQFSQKGLLPRFGPVFTGRAGPAYTKETGKVPDNRFEIPKAMVTAPYHQHYAAANHIAQELLWEGVNDTIARQLPDLIEPTKSLSKARL